MRTTVAVLPGDDAAAVVIDQAARVLTAVAGLFGHEIVLETGLIGVRAIEACGNPLPPETLDLARRADALLSGGSPSGRRWEDPRLAVHPAQGGLGLRRALGLYANLRPVRLYPELIYLSRLKPEIVKNVDLVLVREIGSGIYFGRPSRSWQTKRGRRAVDTTSYSEEEIEQVLRLAFEVARARRRRLTSVDKANVLSTSKLWREVAIELSDNYPEVQLEHMLVDNCAVHLLTRPDQFDVIVTENLFGYILQDVAGLLTGSHGLLGGGALGPPHKKSGRPVGLYEPTRGIAPQTKPDSANPIGAILSAALMLRLSLGLEIEAQAVERAVASAVRLGSRTADMAPEGTPVADSAAMTAAVIEQLKANPETQGQQ